LTEVSAQPKQCPVRPELKLGRTGLNIQEKHNPMIKHLINSVVRLRQDESGQGLVEYLLILALVAFAATAGMTTLASGLNSAFAKIGVILGTYIT
jgi:pilus assembly protein Flp/PilA